MSEVVIFATPDMESGNNSGFIFMRFLSATRQSNSVDSPVSDLYRALKARQSRSNLSKQLEESNDLIRYVIAFQTEFPLGVSCRVVVAFVNFIAESAARFAFVDITCLMSSPPADWRLFPESLARDILITII
jgi:hypothetical protein